MLCLKAPGLGPGLCLVVHFWKMRLSETMEISEIRVLMKYEFHRGATARQAVANIISAFAILVAANATDNRKLSSQWLNKDDPPKRDIHQKKLMVTNWWSGSGVINHGFMEPGKSITANVYVHQPDEMM
ncbi:hypothetical protein NPIL_521421 [Nephila pilipes]|uniref:Uncharacterized protein n=1 Tax=Nephila pilipes TaxID=299642 RepID=A0A8X6N4E4_NEPPI|nr:hypothetical protein NPIL_521421 [Nephila pilipes]